jgi:hypothetical protein
VSTCPDEELDGVCIVRINMDFAGIPDLQEGSLGGADDNGGVGFVEGAEKISVGDECGVGISAKDRKIVGGEPDLFLEVFTRLIPTTPTSVS